MEWWQLQELMMTVAVIVAVLVPVCALTYRLLVKASVRDQKELAGSREAAVVVPGDQRLDHMERQLEDLEGLVRRLVDATEFDRQLRSGEPADEGVDQGAKGDS